MVAAFLRKNGNSVIKRNYQCRFGEIDIISVNKEYIIFTEVKTRKEGSLVSVEYAVDSFKQNRLRATAESFLLKYKTNLQPRFDVALVTVTEKKNGENGYRLRYIKNAF